MQARLKGIHVVVASVENSLESLELKGMASLPHSATIFNAERYSQLPGLIDSIVTATCNGKQTLVRTVLARVLYLRWDQARGPPDGQPWPFSP